VRVQTAGKAAVKRKYLFIFVTINQAHFATSRGSILMGYDAALHEILQAGAYQGEGGMFYGLQPPIKLKFKKSHTHTHTHTHTHRL
jgi:hypothetical protein